MTTMKIYTELRGQKEPELVAYSWHDVIKLGWRFIGQTQDGTRVVMARNGYINEFWQVLA